MQSDDTSITKRQKSPCCQQGPGVMAGEVLRMKLVAKFELWRFVSTAVL